MGHLGPSNKDGGDDLLRVPKSIVTKGDLEMPYPASKARVHVLADYPGNHQLKPRTCPFQKRISIRRAWSTYPWAIGMSVRGRNHHRDSIRVFGPSGESLENPTLRRHTLAA